MGYVQLIKVQPHFVIRIGHQVWKLEKISWVESQSGGLGFHQSKILW